MKKKKQVTKVAVVDSKRSRLSQNDVPGCDLGTALRVAKAISDNYAGKATKPLAVAQAMNVSPQSSQFRMICGASIAYGLTEGGYNAESISITSLGKRIAKPLKEDDDIHAKREAALKPKILGMFLDQYNGSRIPRQEIAKNVIESMGVPKEQVERVFSLIIDTAREVGFIREIKGESYIDINTDITNVPNDENYEDEDEEFNDSGFEGDDAPDEQSYKTVKPNSSSTISDLNTNNRVFITHGKNRSLVPAIQEFLRFGNLEPVISVERETVSKPVPDKVMDDMRSCAAAIIHVEAETQITKEDGTEMSILNPNVLIEIGAAMALYKRKFILLVQNGVKLPSNLQGLYEVRYEGEKLDAETAIRLMKAFNEMKKL